MKRILLPIILTISVGLTACASVTEQTPQDTLRQARINYNATCGEVLRLRLAGKDLPSARQGCITADTMLDAADVAYAAGRLAEASGGATRAMIYITAAQALVAASGAVK